jgi:DNA-binding MarR family transcriptional regulator
MDASQPGRAAKEAAIVNDIQSLTAESDRIGRAYAALNDLSANDFRALLHIMVAENAGVPLTPGELRKMMGMSGAAITYLVERMLQSGHLVREADTSDRRKVILKYSEHGIAVGRAFFTPLAEHTSEALSGLPEADLAAAHRVLGAVLDAMHRFRSTL